MQAVTNTGYPRNMQYQIRRLSGYSRNTFKILSLNQNSASQQSIVTVDLPNNCLIDLSTLCMNFSANATGTGGVNLPRNIESIIERLELEAGGQVVGGSCNYYNHLWAIISDTSFGADVTNRRSVLQNGAIQTTPPTTVQGPTQFSIMNWLGFIGSASPNIISTDLMGNLRLRITLSNPNVNIIGLAPSVSTGFQLTNIYFTVDTISINDGMFAQLQQQYLNQGGVLEVAFRNYFSFTNSLSSMSQTTKISLSSQSLNRMWACFVNQGAPNAYAGVGQVGQTLAAAGTTIGSGIDQNTGNSTYFSRIGNANIAYGNATNYTILSYPLTSYQFSVNNLFYPNYPVTPEFGYNNMLNSYGMSADTLGGGHPNLKSLASWDGSFYVAEQRFNHGDVDGCSLLSGLDTRGSACQAYFYTVGGAITTLSTGGTGYAAVPTGNLTCLVFCEVTSTVRIGNGRQLEIIL